MFRHAPSESASPPSSFSLISLMPRPRQTRMAHADNPAHRCDVPAGPLAGTAHLAERLLGAGPLGVAVVVAVEIGGDGGDDDQGQGQEEAGEAGGGFHGCFSPNDFRASSIRSSAAIEYCVFVPSPCNCT